MEQLDGIYELCVFKGCPNKAQAGGKVLFPFPLSTNPIFETWLENCGNKSIIGRSKPASRKFGLCSDHFTPDSFYDEDKKKLRQDAVPEPYSPLFKRSYPLTRANFRIYDHNYALVFNETEKASINYKRSLYPLRRRNAQITPSSVTKNNKQGNKALKTTSESARPKRGRPLCRIYNKKNLNICKNEGKATAAFSLIGTELDSKSTGLRTASKLGEGSRTEILTVVNSTANLKKNVSVSRRGRRSIKESNKTQGSSPQGGGGRSRDGEVGILQETNAELRSQNELLKELNKQLKAQMKKCQDRNSMLEIQLEKISSIDGFLDFHKCTNRNVRNLIKEEIHKCQDPG